MMTFFEAIFLASVQGLTEFLPISSSGHLVFFQKALAIAGPPVFFDVLLHLGTLGSIVIFFRKEIWDLVFNWEKQINAWSFIILGSIPAAFAGLIFNAKLKATFDSLWLVGVAWALFGALLLLTSKLKIKDRPKKITWRDSLFVGIFQAMALLPGISRSGSTISAVLIRDFSQQTAFKLSFLLAIPAILGATILEIKEDGFAQAFSPLPILSMLMAGVVGYFALLLLQKSLKSEKFYLFGFYCLAIGALAFFLSFRV